MKRLLFVALSAALLVSTVPPFDLWPCALVCWVPLLAACRGLSRPRAAMLGLLQGVLAHALALAPLVPALRGAGGLSAWLAVAGFAAVVLLQALRVALMMAVRPFALGVVLGEMLLPGLFAWKLATTAHAFAPWAQLAEYGGPLLVGFWIACVNELLAERRFAVASLLVAVVTLFGVARMRAVDAELAAAPVARIGVVQGSGATAETTYREASLRLPRGLDLVVWPETALSVPRTLPQLERRGDVGAPLLAGVVLQEGAARFNAAYLSAGELYRKRALVPVGERPLFGFGPAMPFAAGVSAAPLRLSAHSLGVSICYEDTLPAGEGELFVNLTSDGWFPRMASLHLALAELRAVEHRRFLVRATHDGRSVVVDPAGRVVWSLPEGAVASGVAQVRWLTRETLYARLGDWPVALLLALVSLSSQLWLTVRLPKPSYGSSSISSKPAAS